MTDIQIMDIMVKENKDIRLSDSFLGGKSVNKGKGAIINIGIDAPTFQMLARQITIGPQTHRVFTFIINMDEFNEIKNRNVLE